MPPPTVREIAQEFGAVIKKGTPEALGPFLEKHQRTLKKEQFEKLL
jgi:hypothetical protein